MYGGKANKSDGPDALPSAPGLWLSLVFSYYLGFSPGRPDVQALRAQRIQRTGFVPSPQETRAQSAG